MDSIAPRGIQLHIWYAAQVRLLRERAAARSLEDKGYEVFLPWLFPEANASSRSRPGSTGAGSALFPGYLFFRQYEMAAPLVMTTPFLIRIVGSGGRTYCPAPVSGAEIQSIRRVLDSHQTIKRAEFPALGDVVRVVGGPLRGLEGVLCRVRGRSRVTITVASIGRAISVEVEQSWIEPTGVGMDHAIVYAAAAAEA